MALTNDRLTMSSAVEAFARFDTRRQVSILVQQGQTFATERLLDMLRTHDHDRWSSLVVALSDTPQWFAYVDDLAPTARREMAA